MAKAGTIEVDIRANSSQFIRSMRNVERSTKRTADTLKKFGAFAAQSLALFAATGFASGILRTADSIEKLSKRLGVSGKQLQAWQLIAERANVSNNQLNVGIQRLTRRAAEAAKGMGEAQEALKTLGIDAERFNQLSLDDKMLQLARAFEGISDEGERVRLAFKLFDTEGVGFLQFLNDGEDGLRRLREELEGQIWSDEQRAKLSALADQLTVLQQKLELAFGPPIVKILEVFTDSITTAQDALLRLSRTFLVLFGDEGTAKIAADKIKADLLGPTQGGANNTIIVDAGNDAALRNAEKLAQSIVILTAATAAERFKIESELQKKQEALRLQTQERFVSLFTDNLVQASESGFDAVLDGWKRTLKQMLFEAINSRIFSFIAGTGAGASIFGALGLAGFQTGGQFQVGGSGGRDSQVVAFRASPGETVSVSTPGQAAGGGVVLNNSYSFNGVTSADRAEIAAFVETANRRTEANIKDMINRRRFV